MVHNNGQLQLFEGPTQAVARTRITVRSMYSDPKRCIDSLPKSDASAAVKAIEKAADEKFIGGEMNYATVKEIAKLMQTLDEWQARHALNPDKNRTRTDRKLYMEIAIEVCALLPESAEAREFVKKSMHDRRLEKNAASALVKMFFSSGEAPEIIDKLAEGVKKEFAFGERYDALRRKTFGAFAKSFDIDGNVLQKIMKHSGKEFSAEFASIYSRNKHWIYD